MIPASLLLAQLSCARAAQPSSLEVRVATTSVTLGQSVPVLITAKLPAGATLSLDLARSTTDAFAVSQAPDDKAAASELRLAVMPLALGRVPIPLFFTLTDAKGAQAPLPGPAFAFDVTAPGAGPPQLLDIKEPRAASRSWWPWLLLLAAAAAAWLYWRSRRPQRGSAAVEAPVDDRPPEVVALAELAELEASPLWAAARRKEFYWRLTEILRRYLERRFGMPATKLTSAELFRQLRQAELDRPIPALFKDVFDRADLVKFAKVTAEEDWGPRDIAGARAFVEQTTPKAPPVPEAAA